MWIDNDGYLERQNANWFPFSGECSDLWMICVLGKNTPNAMISVEMRVSVRMKRKWHFYNVINDR